MNLIAQHRILVGKKIIAARKFAGLSQDSLAAKMGSSRQQLIRLEKGRHTPTARTLQRLAEATGVDVSFFDVGVADEREQSDDDDEESDPVADLMRSIRRVARAEARKIFAAEREAASA